MAEFKTDNIEEVISDFKEGKPVIIVDAQDRENEGDIAVAGSFITAEHISFMLNHAGGLICASISPKISRRLNIPLQTVSNGSVFGTKFGVSVDYVGVSDIGITAEGRAETIRRLANPISLPSDFVSPGNVFPVIAEEAGVVRRQGQTEGSYDLARLADLVEVSAICEILNDDGEPARREDLGRFARKFGLKVVTIDQIIEYRVKKEALLRESAEKKAETRWGIFTVYVFEDDVDGREHLFLAYNREDWSEYEPLVVRVHSECLTGDVFGSLRCDCGDQLDLAMQSIVREGKGALIYLRQEGRDIGLANKLRAYQLQDRGYDTVEANVKLGFRPDERNFLVAARMLKHFNISEIILLTNNPRKRVDIEKAGIKVVERRPLVVSANPYNERYLSCKKERLGHIL